MSSKTTRTRRLLGDRSKDDDGPTTNINRPFTSIATNVTDSLLSTGKSNIDVLDMSFYLYKSIFLGNK